jgi:hypothetical protein
MLYKEVIAVCSEIHTKHVNTLCGQNVYFVNVKPGGSYSDHCGFTFKQMRWYLNFNAYLKESACKI